MGTIRPELQAIAQESERPEPLTVWTLPVREIVRRQPGPWLLSLSAAIVYSLVREPPGLSLVVLLLTLAGVGCWAMARPRQVWMVVDGAGLRFPILGVVLGWHQVAAVVVEPTRSGRPVTKVVPYEPRAVIGSAKWTCQCSLWVSLVLYGTPLVLDWRLADAPAETIVAAIEANRRYA